MGGSGLSRFLLWSGGWCVELCGRGAVAVLPRRPVLQVPHVDPGLVFVPQGFPGIHRSARFRSVSRLGGTLLLRGSYCRYSCYGDQSGALLFYQVPTFYGPGRRRGEETDSAYPALHGILVVSLGTMMGRMAWSPDTWISSSPWSCRK